MAKPKKKSMTIRLGSDAVMVMDVVKQAIDNNDFGYVDSQAQFFEILVMNYAYQVLNDIDTFTKRQSMVKQALSDKDIEMYKYVDVTTPNGYGCVRLDNDVNELEQKLEQNRKEEMDNEQEVEGSVYSFYSTDVHSSDSDNTKAKKAEIKQIEKDLLGKRM